MRRRWPAQALIIEKRSAQQYLYSLARKAFPHSELRLAVSTRPSASPTLPFNPVDLLLVDLDLPDAAGLAAVRAAKQLHSPQSTPCVVFSSHDDDEHIFAAIAAGADGYLLKTEPDDALVERLRQLLNGVPALSSPIVHRLVKQLAHLSRHDDATQAASAHPPLSPREQDVLHLIAQGQRITDVANTLHISAHTVCSHLKSIYRKLDVSTRAEVALAARRLGLV